MASDADAATTDPLATSPEPEDPAAASQTPSRLRKRAAVTTPLASPEPGDGDT